MNSRDWLYLLMFTADQMSRPTLRNLLSSYEEFEHRHRPERDVLLWEKRGWVKRSPDAEDVVFALTEQGKQEVMVGVNPEVSWDRPWDGAWRMLLFDLPSPEKRLRMNFWRWLREHRFGYLQNSVWIRPHIEDPLVQTMEWFRDNPEQFLLLESRNILGISDEAMVQGAWDFIEINRRYKDYLERIDSWMTTRWSVIKLPQLIELIAEERNGYKTLLERDPLLPKALLPSDYMGRKACESRKKFLRRLRTELRRKLA